MTQEQVQAAIGIEGVTVAISSNGHHYWATATMDMDGRQHSRSTRVPLEPTDADLERVRDVFQAWRRDEQR